jgi:hypothetical protein
MAVVLAAALAVVAVVEIVRDPEIAAPPRRIVLLVLTSFALPVVALALFFPVRPGTVFVALTATASVGVMAALNASMFRLRAAVKLWIWLATLPVVIGYVDTLTRIAPALGPLAWPAGADLTQELAAVLAGLTAPIALVPARVWRAPSLPLAIAVGVALVPTIAFGLLAVLTWPVTQGLALRAVGIGLQVPYGQALYLGALFGWVLTAAYHLWPRPQPGGVQEIGLSMCALLFGGIGTFTPFRIALLLFGLLGLALGLHRLAQLERAG